MNALEIWKYQLQFLNFCENYKIIQTNCVAGEFYNFKDKIVNWKHTRQKLQLRCYEFLHWWPSKKPVK